MAFLIESDPAFPAATARSARSATNVTDSKSGEAFARSLRQDSGAADSASVLQVSPDRTDGNKAHAQPMQPDSSETDSRDETDRADSTMLPFSALPSQEDIEASPEGDGTDAASEIQLSGSRTDTAAVSRETHSKADPVFGATEGNETEEATTLRANTDTSGSTNGAISPPGKGDTEFSAQAETDTPVNTAAVSGGKPDGAASSTQALLVQATSGSSTGQKLSGNSASGFSVKATPDKQGVIPGTGSTTSSAMAGQTADLTEVSADTPDASPEERLPMADLSIPSPENELHTGHSGKPAQAAQPSDGSTQVPAPAFGALPSSQAPTQTAQPQPQMTPANALITAGPAETVKIITDAIASPDDTPDHITVQLDPPELGRVSIDFKFDANGLQHITVTGDSPEALKQLRLMHFELTQALERNGLSSQNMTFQQQQSGQQQSHASTSGRILESASAGADTSSLTTANLPADSIRPARKANGGLDIRL